MTIPNEVFLSHASLDESFVTPLADSLARHGVPVWYSKRNLLGAQQWHDEIGAALKRCDWFALILSPNAVTSRWVRHELHFALQQDRFSGRIVPLVYLPCDYDQLSWVLPSLQMIDFQQPFEDACRELLRTWGIGYVPKP